MGRNFWESVAGTGLNKLLLALGAHGHLEGAHLIHRSALRLAVEFPLIGEDGPLSVPQIDRDRFVAIVRDPQADVEPPGVLHLIQPPLHLDPHPMGVTQQMPLRAEFTFGNGDAATVRRRSRNLDGLGNRRQQ